jgi:hypothetical protein
MKKSELKQIIKEEIEKTISEIKVNKPVGKYYLNPIYKNWYNKNYDEVAENFGEDEAVAFSIFHAASQDHKTISITDVINFFNQNEDMRESWGDPTDFLSYLEEMDIIQKDKPVTNEIKISNTLNEALDSKKFEKAVLDSSIVYSNINLTPSEILDSVLAGLILKMGLDNAKRYVEELADMYKSLYQ